MITHKSIMHLLFMFYILYFSQGFFYTSGSMVSQSLLVLILLFCFFYFVKIYLGSQSYLFIQILSIFYLLHAVGFLLTIDSENRFYVVDLFKVTSISLLSFFPFYYFAKNGQLSPKNLLVFFGAFASVSIVNYYWGAANTRDMLGLEHVTINKGYTFAILAPFILLFKKNRFLPVVILVVFTYFVLNSAKRGAILIWILTCIIYGFYIYKTINKKSRIAAIVGMLVFVAAISFMAYLQFSNYDYLQIRFAEMVEGNASNRSFYYHTLFDNWQYSKTTNFYFGHGLAATWKIVGNYAHNDWLELVTNFGVLGVFLYGVIFMLLARIIYKNSWPLDKKVLLVLIVMNLFLRSVFSMGYINSDNFLLFILLGYLLGSCENCLSTFVDVKVSANMLVQ